MSKENNPLWSALFRRHHHDEAREMLNFLGSSPLFCALAKKELRHLVAIVHRRSYEEGEFVFRKGQPGAAMFIIKSGAVDIIDHAGENRDTIIATLNSEDFFGELALLDDSLRSASAMVTSPADIYAFSRTDLENMVTTFPQMGMRIYQALAIIIGTRLKAANAQLSDQ
ncbi:MAG: cyclic nucleotide-binding domain-containing protein [Desulfobulbaceae bacterium]|nr:cyclic nucleotide-binding domain-containing protein [Desulfobulbaceae bacterium]